MLLIVHAGDYAPWTGWATFRPDCIDRVRKHYSQLVEGWFLPRKAASALNGCMTMDNAANVII